MNKELLIMILKLVIFMPFILGLIYLSFKFGGARLQNMQNGRFMKIIERVPVSKDSSLIAVQIGSKGYVMSSGGEKLKILLQLEPEELEELKKAGSIPKFTSLEDMKRSFTPKRKVYHDKNI